MAKQDVEMKEAPKQNDTAETEEPKAEVSKEEKERLVLEGMISQFKIEKKKALVRLTYNFSKLLSYMHFTNWC